MYEQMLHDQRFKRVKPIVCNVTSRHGLVLSTLLSRLHVVKLAVKTPGRTGVDSQHEFSPGSHITSHGNSFLKMSSFLKEAMKTTWLLSGTL